MNDTSFTPRSWLRTTGSRFRDPTRPYIFVNTIFKNPMLDSPLIVLVELRRLCFGQW